MSIWRGLFMAIVAFVPGIGHASDPVSLPGGIWAIVPPPGFAVVQGPVAVLRHPSGAFIIIQDRPKQPISRSDFVATAEQQDRIVMGEVVEVTVNGRPGLLATSRHPTLQAKGMTLGVEGETSSGFIVAIVPDSAGPEVSTENVRQSLLTAVERPRDMRHRLGDLPFVLGDMAGMRVSAVGASLVMLTDGPSDDQDRAVEQSFANIAIVEITAADPPGLSTDFGSLRTWLEQKYPDVRILDTKVLDAGDVKIGEITYERTAVPGNELVAGVLWAKPLGTHIAIMFCQYPRGGSAALQRFNLIRDGLTSK